jgi:hypothetical protein
MSHRPRTFSGPKTPKTHRRPQPAPARGSILQAFTIPDHSDTAPAPSVSNTRAPEPPSAPRFGQTHSRPSSTNRKQPPTSRGRTHTPVESDRHIVISSDEEDNRRSGDVSANDEEMAVIAVSSVSGLYFVWLLMSGHVGSIGRTGAPCQHAITPVD